MEKALPNRIREWRKQRRLTLEQLGEAAGTSAQQIAKLELGERRLTVDWMTRIAKGLGVEPADLISAPDDLPPSNVDLSNIRTSGLAGATDLPVYSSAQGGPGELIVTYEAIEYVRRPEPLFGVDGGFAIYLVGSSMSPRLKHGDLALVHPTRPPRPGDDVLIIKETRGNEHYCMVKELVSIDDNRAVIRQHNPPKEWEINLEGVEIKQIVGNYYQR